MRPPHTPKPPAGTAGPAGPDAEGGLPRGLLALLTCAAFVIFTQAFMIAPILPRLAAALGTTPARWGSPCPPTSSRTGR